jgi:hypothetical protein
MIKFYMTSLLLVLCLGALCIPASQPVALPVSRMVNLLCLAWFMQGLWDQIKTHS